MKLLIFILTMGLGIVHIQAQNTFIRSFGTSDGEFGNNLVRTSDGKFAMTLSTPSNPPLNSMVNIALLKLDEIGHLEWKQEYLVDSSTYAFDLIQTNDGGFLIGGWLRYGNFNQNRMLLIKTNNAGVYQWIKTYSATASDVIKSIKQTSDGGYVFAATINSNINIESVNVTKLDANGNVSWCRNISYAGEVLAECIAETSSGDIVVCGTGGYGIFTDIFITKFKSNGNFLWTRSFGTTYDDTPTAMKINDLDEIYVCGYSYFTASASDAFIFKTDTGGILKNELFYDAGTPMGEFARGFDFYGGRIALTGDMGTFDERDAFIALINTNGTTEWVNKYPIAPQFTNYPYELVSVPGDGVAITGDFRTSFASREGLIIKTNRNGDAGCYTTPVVLQKMPHHFDSLGVFFTILPSTVVQATIQNAGMLSDVTEKQICEFIYPVADFDTSGLAVNCPQYCFNFHDTTKYEPVQWQWSFEGGTPPVSADQHPQQVCFSNSGIYAITLIAANQYTSDTITHLLSIDLQCPVSVPDVFSPNSDGINDIFQVYGLPQEFTLTIYNRWGNKVFETEDPAVMWNGKIGNKGNQASAGVYYYVLTGNTLPKPQTGFLHLF